MAAFRSADADVERPGLRGHDHVRRCTGIRDGTALLLEYTGALNAAAEAGAASAATGAATAERLPAAPRAASAARLARHQGTVGAKLAASFTGG